MIVPVVLPSRILSLNVSVPSVVESELRVNDIDPVPEEILKDPVNEFEVKSDAEIEEPDSGSIL